MAYTPSSRHLGAIYPSPLRHGGCATINTCFQRCVNTPQPCTLRRAKRSVKSLEKAVRRVCGRPVMFCTSGIEIAH
jgi:hypothetical protein